MSNSLPAGWPVVINAAGKMTALGGSAQHTDVAAAASAAAAAHLDMTQFRQLAAARVAAVTGAQGACITTGAAAGICISVAALVAGNNPQRIAQLPLTDGVPNRIVLQKGHDIDFGTTVTQMIRLGGGIPTIVGSAAGVTADDIDHGISADCAGLLYVQSHHCVQHGRVDLATCIELAHARGVPVVVDAAAEEDLRRFVAAGADLVTYSGGKAIGGPTVGFIAGLADRIAACEAQSAGIARTMKVGKEQIAGLLAALERYPPADEPGARGDRLFDELSALNAARISRVPDRGRPGHRSHRHQRRVDPVCAAGPRAAPRGRFAEHSHAQSSDR